MIRGIERAKDKKGKLILIANFLGGIYEQVGKKEEGRRKPREEKKKNGKKPWKKRRKRGPGAS